MIKEIKENYFIGLVPNEIITSHVLELKLSAKDEFGVAKALRSPAHITIVPPFLASQATLTKVLDLLEQSIKQYKSLIVRVGGVKHFNAHTIYLDVENNQELQAVFVNLFNAVNKIVNTKSYPEFIPHITLANQDIDKESFSKILAYFKKCLKDDKQEIIINELVLFKLGKEVWEPYTTYFF